MHVGRVIDLTQRFAFHEAGPWPVLLPGLSCRPDLHVMADPESVKLSFLIGLTTERRQQGYGGVNVYSEQGVLTVSLDAANDEYEHVEVRLVEVGGDTDVRDFHLHPSEFATFILDATQPSAQGAQPGRLDKDTVRITIKLS